ncbi:MAG TPA: polysaccharide deacetylase family protein [Vicinamibacterales bacterium]|nr:polysaccharide deacetylase family protein [Vicinamibacterales bacterium]
MSDTTIGAVIRCGNQVSQVYASVRSLLDGSRPPDIIAIVADPATPDRADEWLSAFAKFRGGRFARVSSSRPGAAWNAGLSALGRVDFGLCLEAGDRLDRRGLELFAQPFTSDAVVLATSAIEWLGPGSQRRFTVPDECSPAALLRDFHAAHISSLFRWQAWHDANGFDEELAALEHTDLWLRLLASGAQGTVDSRPLLRRSVRRTALYRRTWEGPDYAQAVRRLMERHREAAAALTGPMLEARDRDYHRVLKRYQTSLGVEAAATASLAEAHRAHQAALAPVPADWGHTLEWGPQTRSVAFSHDWGYDRGTPVDRPFIERFLQAHAVDIRGTVLEIQEDDYTRRLGAGEVERREVLDLDPANTLATIVGDLRSLDHVPADTFDCIVLTQTLHVIDDMGAVLGECRRVLKPGGVLLATLPSASRVCLEYGRDADYWRVTAAGARQLFSQVFAPASVDVETFGNSLVNAAFSFGLASEDLPSRSFEAADPYFPLLVGVRAVKTAGPPAIVRAGTAALPVSSLAEGQRLIVLYHRVAASAVDPHRLSVSSVTFAAQVDWLSRVCRVLPLDSLVTASSDAADSRPGVSLTFDDGYVDNLQNASPVLRAGGLPATFFVTTAGLDSSAPYVFWWDRLAAAFAGNSVVPPSLTVDLPEGPRTLPTSSAEERVSTHWQLHGLLVRLPAARRDSIVAHIEHWAGQDRSDRNGRRMNSQELVELASHSGHALGAHTVEHLALPDQPDDVVARELVESRRTLEQLSGRPVRSFAYPFGAVDHRTAAAARANGFELAVTCEERSLRRRENPLRLPRISAFEEPLERFIARVERALGVAAGALASRG